MRSVQFMGREITLEQALDEVIRGSQNKLNELQVALRELAMLESGDQAIDEEEDFRACVSLEDQTQDLVAGFIELLEELPDIAADIRGSAPSKATKAWFAEHKRERKAELVRRKEETKLRLAQEKAARDAAKANPDAAAAR